MPRKRPPQPEDLLFMLVDSVMARLSPNAWKVVSYVASQHMRVQDDFFLRRANPAIFYLNRDIEQKTGMDMVELPGEQRLIDQAVRRCHAHAGLTIPRALRSSASARFAPECE